MPKDWLEHREWFVATVIKEREREREKNILLNSIERIEGRLLQATGIWHSFFVCKKALCERLAGDPSLKWTLSNVHIVSNCLNQKFGSNQMRYKAIKLKNCQLLDLSALSRQAMSVFRMHSPALSVMLTLDIGHSFWWSGWFKSKTSLSPQVHLN